MSNATIDQQFIEYVVKSLVSNPDDVIVERTIDEKGVLLTLTVNPEDLGRVIGKRGATAQSLRTLLRALGTKQEARYNLKIVDNGFPKPEREERSERTEKTTEVVPAEATASENTEASEDAWGSDDNLSAAKDAADASGEEESSLARTRKELEDLDDLDI